MKKTLVLSSALLLMFAGGVQAKEALLWCNYEKETCDNFYLMVDPEKETAKLEIQILEKFPSLNCIKGNLEDIKISLLNFNRDAWYISFDFEFVLDADSITGKGVGGESVSGYRLNRETLELRETQIRNYEGVVRNGSTNKYKCKITTEKEVKTFLKEKEEEVKKKIDESRKKKAREEEEQRKRNKI